MEPITSELLQQQFDGTGPCAAQATSLRPSWLRGRPLSGRHCFCRLASPLARSPTCLACTLAPLLTFPPVRPPARLPACSFTSLWFISTTTPTVYSLVGSLNKVPLALIGLFAFNTPWTMPNLASISVGLVAGVVFVVAKSRS